MSEAYLPDDRDSRPACPSCGNDSLRPRLGHFRDWYWCLSCAAYQTDP